MKASALNPMIAAVAFGLAVAAFAGPTSLRAVANEDEAYGATTGATTLVQEDPGEPANIIPPSMVYRIAHAYVPGCTVLRVSLDHAAKVYAVKVKSGNEVRRLIVDARTGEVVGD